MKKALMAIYYMALFGIVCSIIYLLTQPEEKPQPIAESACLLQVLDHGENFIISEDQSGEYNYSLITTARGEIEVWGKCK